jgi:hypothetical protein
MIKPLALRTITRIILCTLLPAMSAVAQTTLYANNSCSNNGNGSASTCAASTGGAGAYNTFASLVSACTTAGDNCIVEAGDYTSEAAQTISRSGTGTNGTCTACITFEGVSAASVSISPLQVNANNIVIETLTVTDPTFTKGSAGIYLDSGATNVQILNNTVTQVGEANSGQTSSGYPCIGTNYQSGGVHYVTISGNTISWCSALSSEMNQAGGNAHISQGITPAGDHILLLNNDISHTNAGILPGSGSSYWAVLGNTYHDAYIGTVDGTPPEWDALGCIVTNDCNTHLDSAYFINVSNLVFEGNTYLRLWGTGGGFAQFSGGGTPNSDEVVFRFNAAYQVNTFMGGYYSTTNYWKWYNNTAVGMAQQSGDSSGVSNCGHGGTNTSTGSSYINNLHYNTNNPAGRVGAVWYQWFSECSMGSQYNLLYDTSCSPSTLANCASGSGLTDAGNIWANPQLVATDGSNFNLQSGSPALNAGTYLTTVSSGDAGSGTSLIVNDAAFFQAGMGIPGVSNDCIAVTTVTMTVCATAINYSTNTITLANSITRSSGDHVWLYSDARGITELTGSAPNIGSGGGSGPPPTPPTNLFGVVQ